MTKLLLPYCVFFIIFNCLFFAKGFTQAIQPGTYVTNGTVNASVTDPSNVYIGGQFSYVGPYSGPTGAIDASSGNVDITFPVVEGAGAFVNSVIQDGSGGWFIAGSFTTVGGASHNNIAHIKSDKTVDATWNANPNGIVDCMALSGTSLFVGGRFFAVGGTARNHIAALNATNGSLIAGWSANTNGAVNAIAVSGSSVYLGGQFTTVRGISRTFLAKVDNTTGVVNGGWNPVADAVVYSIILTGTNVFIGGAFTNVSGTSRNYLAKLDATSGVPDPIWDANPGNVVYCLATDGISLYAGGQFNSMGGVARNYLACVDASGSGSLNAGWDPGANNIVYAMLLNGTTVYAGGSFVQIGGLKRNYIAAIDASSGSVTTWDPNASNMVKALDIDFTAKTVFAGGQFNSIGGKTRNNAASVKVSTGIVTSWDPNPDGVVNALAISPSGIYLGGLFATVNGGIPRKNLALVNNTSGGVNLGWTPDPDLAVSALAVSGASLFVGGSFNNIAGVPRNRIACLSTSGSASATSWDPNITGGGVNCLTVSSDGNTVYTGGNFTTVGSGGSTVTRNNIASIDAASGIAITGWNPNANGPVNSLLVLGPVVYAGGSFSNIGGAARSTLAAIDATGTATGWDPNPAGGSTVNALATEGTNIFAGGDFTQIGTGPLLRDGLALIDPSGSVTTWNPNPSNPIDDVPGNIFNTLTINGLTIYAGGSYSSIANTYRTNFASFPTTIVILPVKLLEFTAQSLNGNVQIQWETANEDPGTTYSVLRSSSGNTFEKVYTTNNSDFIKTVNQYSYADKALSAGTYYYKLEIRENNGVTSYSSVKRVIIGRTGEIKVIAVAGADNFTVISPSEFILKLYASNGTILQSVMIHTGENKIILPPSKGIYIYNILDNENKKILSGKVIR